MSATIKNRPVPLTTEIQMHICVWIADQDFNKLPSSYKEAIRRLQNEIKIHEAIIAQGEKDNIVEETKDEAKKFFAIYRKMYGEYAGMDYEFTIDATTRFIVRESVKKLISEGSSTIEYLEWFFNDFMKDEYNKKKFAPPTINIATNKICISKFLFANKERLQFRKSQLAEATIRDGIAELAVQFLEQHSGKDFTANFAQNVQKYMDGSITTKKISSIFLSLLEEHNDLDKMNKLKKIIGE